MNKESLDRHITGDYGERQFYKSSKAWASGQRARRAGKPQSVCRCRSTQTRREWIYGWCDEDMCQRDLELEFQLRIPTQNHMQIALNKLREWINRQPFAADAPEPTGDAREDLCRLRRFVAGLPQAAVQTLPDDVVQKVEFALV